VTGTIINVITVVVGSLAGLFFGARLPERARQTVVAGLGLFTLVFGIQMFFKSENALIVLGSILLGGILGEVARIEDRLAGLGAWLEGLVMRKQAEGNGRSQFVKGFLTASLVFCVGPMAILGAIQDGLTGDYQLLAVKSVLDGFASLAFAATLGIGVIFSALTVLVYQGGISLAAFQVQTLMTEAMMLEMTATGGVILTGIAISSLLEIKPIRVGNFLPALLIAPLIVALLTILTG
jgi:uncharacterized protein